jgi:hypothetical protein
MVYFPQIVLCTKKNSIKINKLLKQIRTKNQILEHFMFVE